MGAAGGPWAGTGGPRKAAGRTAAASGTLAVEFLESWVGEFLLSLALTEAAIILSLSFVTSSGCFGTICTKG